MRPAVYNSPFTQPMSQRAHPYVRHSNDHMDPLSKTRLEMSTLLADSSMLSSGLTDFGHLVLTPDTLNKSHATPVTKSSSKFSPSAVRTRELEGQLLQHKSKEIQLNNMVTQLKTQIRELQQNIQELNSFRVQGDLCGLSCICHDWQTLRRTRRRLSRSRPICVSKKNKKPF
jgi:hypothetical protein